MAAFSSRDTTISYESGSTLGVTFKGRGGRGGPCGGCCHPEPGVELKENKKTKIKLVVALDGSRRVERKQQPTKNMRARRRVHGRGGSAGGERREGANRSFGDDQAGRGDKKLK